VRLAKELAGLASLLPISSSSSVFVRVDNKRQQLWRVLMTGPDDTPYSNGCFIFDCYFPGSYPSEPPKVLLLTTGDNTVCFNPNLYENGKVCLSLLGTWKGDRAESWDPVNSRMLQVLVSIQSLILVPEPYFNEPGFEREIGTKMGESRSREYSEPVRENCIRWAMIDQLRRRSPGHVEFSDVLELHFRLRSRKIQEVVASWVTAAINPHQVKLMSLQSELANELKKMEASGVTDIAEKTDSIEVPPLTQEFSVDDRVSVDYQDGMHYAAKIVEKGGGQYKVVFDCDHSCCWVEAPSLTLLEAQTEPAPAG
jgi:baculoviral IAP repeat-containing protein 6